MKKEVIDKLEAIVKKSESIDIQKISDEVLSWLIKNVENFIDNHNRLFKLDIIIDQNSSETMAETKRLQDLYLSIPDETKVESWEDVLNLSKEDTSGILKDAAECRNTLDEIVARAYELMRKDAEKLNKLFEKMSFFYELKGVNRGRLLIQQLAGSTDIIRFEYEAFEVPVKIFKKTNQLDENKDLVSPEEEQKELIKEYVVPEGFTVWVEISFKPLEQTTSLF